jgi:phage repressor protein C with HTH and peptisase S24 domain
MQQKFCTSTMERSLLSPFPMSSYPSDPILAGAWLRRARDMRGLSTTETAARAKAVAFEEGDLIKLSQQLVSKFEQCDSKRLPHWLRYVQAAFEIFDDESGRQNHDAAPNTDDSVAIKRLPLFAGMGSGSTADGEDGSITFSRDLIFNDLRADPEKLLAIHAEGNSMEPDYKGGDQILVDTRRTSLSQPGAFCIWDGDGHVIKFIERVQGSEPARIRIISANGIYEPTERLVDEVNIIGRVVWFGRRVQ